MSSFVCRECAAHVDDGHTQPFGQRTTTCPECGTEHVCDFRGQYRRTRPLEERERIRHLTRYMDQLELRWRDARFERAEIMLRLVEEEGWEVIDVAGYAGLSDTGEVRWTLAFYRAARIDAQESWRGNRRQFGGL